MPPAPAATAASFFWHDYETFGRVPRRDRPAQFAGLRTDAALNEIGEPVVHYCRPAPDFLPDPQACLLTGILPQHCLQQGVPEQAFALAIEAELGAPGTIGVGYNSIRFDDEVTRFLFWRNLIDPYAREWQNGCSRWDLMDALRCAWALRPEGLVWPKHDDGRPSFKLEHLSAANGVAHESAHDALSDVRATLGLARLLKARQPRLWDFCLKLRDKNAVRDEIGVDRPFVHVSGRYPAERGCLALVWPLAPHPVNRNEVIVWDLAQDPRQLQGLDADALRERLFTRESDLPEGVQRLPIKTIHLNKSPIVVSGAGMMKAAATRWGIDLEAVQRHAGYAKAIAPELLPRWAAVFGRQAAPGGVDVDEDLYGGFIGDEDRRTLQRLRGLAPAALAERHPAFGDPRLAELLFRYRARNYPDTLSADEHAQWQRHCAARLHEGAGGAFTLARYFEAIDALAEDADERQQALLEALYDYGEAIAPEDS